MRIPRGKTWELPIVQGQGPQIGMVSLPPYSTDQTVTVTTKIQGEGI